MSNDSVFFWFQVSWTFLILFIGCAVASLVYEKNVIIEKWGMSLSKIFLFLTLLSLIPSIWNAP